MGHWASKWRLARARARYTTWHTHFVLVGGPPVEFFNQKKKKMENLNWRHVAASVCCGVGIGVVCNTIWTQQSSETGGARAATPFKHAQVEEAFGKRKKRTEAATTITFLGTGSSTGEMSAMKITIKCSALHPKCQSH